MCPNHTLSTILMEQTNCPFLFLNCKRKVIDDGNSLQKVQVRCTGRINKRGRFEVSVKSGGTRGVVYSHVKETDIDILFVVCTNGWLFEIPKEKITQSSTINLFNEKSKFSCSKEDYSQFLVSFDFST